MTKSALICALGILAIVAVGSVAAQSQDKYASGTVVSSSSTTLVVKTEAGDQMTFKLDSQSAVPTQLKADDKIDVRYQIMDDGTFQVAEVRTVGSQPESTGTTGQTGAPAQESGSKPLPRTASPVVLIGVIGLGSLGAAAGLKALTR